jgi:uncharacterized protein (DUF305 family)
MNLFRFRSDIELRTFVKIVPIAIACFLAVPICAQQPDREAPVVVQPGAPGQPTRVLPSTIRPTLPLISRKDIEFMQGMIMHHAQAVEMTALIPSRTDNKELRLLGARISHSQAEEMRFMRNWLIRRGQPVSMPNMSGGHAHHGMAADDLMPGMLTPKQMAALRNAKGKDFDRLFLEGMIQHHNGALIMVEELFGAPGAGQDAELFSFATDVDSGQRAEIEVMRAMLDQKTLEK